MKTANRTLGIAAALAFCCTGALGNALANTPEATTASDPSGQTAPAVAAPAAEPSDAATETKETPNFGPGMRIPVDGTSLAAFEKSLEDIKAKTTRAEYTTLTNAIDWLMVYDLQAKRDRTKLAALLNGKTGEEIDAMVEW